MAVVKTLMEIMVTSITGNFLADWALCHGVVYYLYLLLLLLLLLLWVVVVVVVLFSLCITAAEI